MFPQFLDGERNSNKKKQASNSLMGSHLNLMGSDLNLGSVNWGVFST